MNKDNATPKPQQPEQPSPKGLDGATCSAFDFEARKQRFEDAVGSLDRYGTPHDGIINILDALSDFIDDEAHGRGGYEVYFKIIQDELDSLRSGYLPNR
jgi:hypothetical protein